MATDHTPPAAEPVRDQLLHALAYCQGIGYQSPEELLDAYDASRTPPAELAQRLGAIRQQMANAATDRPTPQQLADWDEFDRNMASRIQKARPGIPLHHAYATLQTLRAIQQAEAPTAVLPPPVSRATVLREAADRAEVVALRLRLKRDYGAASGAYDVRAELRRLAGEAQPECSASRTGHCLREAESETACDTEAGECVHGGRPADEAQPGTEAERVVAYRSLGGRILRCLNHIPPEPDDDFVPVTPDDLPDGGVCTYPECGVDVLIPQPAVEPQREAPWTTDGARIGRVLIWSHADIGDGDFGRGYRAAQEEARAILTRTLLTAAEAQRDGAQP